MENSYLIVGLGNPGAEYELTRHNAGFLLSERLANRWRTNWSLERKFNARMARTELEGRKALLVQPQTFMNLSGEAVRAVLDYYQIPVEQALVLVDDADLPLGEIRLRERGSSGGHHGLQSIEQHLATQEYARLRLGIGRTATGERQIQDYVLSRFGADETELLDKILERAADQVECWLAAGVQRAMAQFNGTITMTKEPK